MFSRMSLTTNYTLLFSIISYKTTTYILHAILLYIDNQGNFKREQQLYYFFFYIIYISSSIYSLLHDIKRQIRLFTSNVTQTPKGFQKVFIYIIRNIDIRKVLKGSYVRLCTSSSMSSRTQTSKEFQEAIMYVYIRRT